MKIPRIALQLLLATSASVANAHATAIYTSYSAGLSSPGYGAPFQGTTLDANSFSLSSNASLQAMTFAALDCCGDTTFIGSINYYLFNDNSGSPASTPFAQGSTSIYLAAIAYTDIATNVVTDYTFNLTTPVALSGSTTYWIGLNINSSNSDASNWNSCTSCSGINAASTAGSQSYSWRYTYGKGAFVLYDTPAAIAPEPTGFSMTALGIAAVLGGIFRHRRVAASRPPLSS